MFSLVFLNKNTVRTSPTKLASSGSDSTDPIISTNINRDRRSREFFFGYFLFDGQKESDDLASAIPEKDKRCCKTAEDFSLSLKEILSLNNLFCPAHCRGGYYFWLDPKGSKRSRRKKPSTHKANSRPGFPSGLCALGMVILNLKFNPDPFIS